MIKAVELRKGRAVVYEDAIWFVHEAQHVAKGNKRSYMQTKLKSMQSGQIVDVRFRVDDMLDTPFLASKEYEYLYEDGQDLVLMNTETYDQVHMDRELLGEAGQFLKPNEKLSCQVYEGTIVSAELPNVVELKVVEAPPMIKRATATGQTKDVVLETGARVRVPAFVDAGTVIRVDTRNGEYLERAK